MLQEDEIKEFVEINLQKNKENIQRLQEDEIQKFEEIKIQKKNLNNNDIIELESTEPTKVFENWKGLGIETTKNNQNKRSSYYATPNPEIMYSDEQNKMEIALIKNGSIVNKVKPTKYNNETFILMNTCPYYSILQAIACAYCDSKKYSTIIKINYKSIDIYNILKTLVTEGFSKSFIIQ